MTASRPVAAFDIDGTVIREQTLLLVTQTLARFGIFDETVAVELRKVMKRYNDREIDFRSFDLTLVDIFVRHLAGRSEKDVRFAIAKTVAEYRDLRYVFTTALMRRLRPTHHMVAITGALHEFMEEVAEYWEFDAYYGSRMTLKDGMYTGGHEPHIPVEDKCLTLCDHVYDAKGPLTLTGSVAIGDTSSDIGMFDLVDVPIAFNPNDSLRRVAESKGWPIVVERKNCVFVIRGGQCRIFGTDRIHEPLDAVLLAT